MSGTSEDHVANLVHNLDPGAMVTKFVVIAEIIDTEGDQAVWMDTNDGSNAWDVLGLLAYAKAVQLISVDREDDIDDDL